MSTETPIYDRYSQEVERLTAKAAGDTQALLKSWGNMEPLFRFVHPKYDCEVLPGGGQCGCLTQIRARTQVAFSEELTIAICADERLPTNACEIAAANLPVFAEWNRRIDRELGRTPPPLLQNADYPSERAYQESIQAAAPSPDFPQTRRA